MNESVKKGGVHMSALVNLGASVPRFLGGELYPDGSWRALVGVPGAWEACFRVEWDEAEKCSGETTLVSVSNEDPDSGPLEAELRYASSVAGFSQSREAYLSEVSAAHDPT